MKTEQEILWPCPVCGYDSFGEPPGSFGVCSVCGWEDDPSQIRHPRTRGGANTGSIFDYQQDQDSWIITDRVPRDPDWRPLESNEAALPTGEIGVVDYTLDFYAGCEPYYWRKKKRTAEQPSSAIRSRLKMKCFRFAIIVMALSIWVDSASASPYIGTDLSVEIGAHRWGFWTLIDTPSHDLTSRAFRETRWMNDGSEGVAAQRFYSYWIIGLGQFGAVYMSRGFALALVGLIALFVTVWVRQRRRGEQ